MRIKAYVRWNDYTRTHYYENFDVIDTLPKIGDYYDGCLVIDVKSVELDCEQGNSEVYNYNFYEVVTDDGDGDVFTDNVSILKDIDM